MLEGFNSYDENGMLQSIVEMRKLGLALAEFIGEMISDPLVQMLVPREKLRMIVAMYTSSVSAFKKTSQAEQMRLAAKALGMSESDANSTIDLFGLSEVYPQGHPDAADIEAILKSLVEDTTKGTSVKLPESIENFLSELLGQ